MTSGYSMLAMILNRPPQAHCSMSLRNTRFSRSAQFMAWRFVCRGCFWNHASTPLRLHHLAPNLAVRRK